MKTHPSRIGLLALDVDGTLTDSGGEVRQVVIDRVREARERGVEVVLCTGRRYRTTEPLIRALDLSGPVVVHNGVVVKDCQSGRTTSHSYLLPDDIQRALVILRRIGTPLVYVDRHHEGVDMLTEPGNSRHPYQDEYVQDNLRVVRFVETLGDEPLSDAIMLSCMADEEGLLAVQEEIRAALGNRLRTNFLMNKSYRGHILETAAGGSGKWPALRAIARDLGVGDDAIMAIGDDNNDAEMVRGAGLGIAMGNAVASVRDAADETTDDHDHDGVARAIERFILG